MDTQQEKQQVESLSAELTDTAAEILQALDDLHGKIVQAYSIEKDLAAARENVSSVPGAISLPWFDLSKKLQTVFTDAYLSLGEPTRAALAEKGIKLQDWAAEFLGEKPVVR